MSGDTFPGRHLRLVSSFESCTPLSDASDPGEIVDRAEPKLPLDDVEQGHWVFEEYEVLGQNGVMITLDRLVWRGACAAVIRLY